MRDCCRICSARRGPTRSRAHSTRRCSGAASAAWCWRSSASRRSTNTSIAQMGTDRVFNPVDLPPVSEAVFWLGIAAFAAALAVGVYLTVRGGWPILAFALLGGAAAIFYEAPPIRWSYRGLGEIVIALSYGPWMVLGSLYLHTRAVSWAAFGVAGACRPHHGAGRRERNSRLPSGPPGGQAQSGRAPRTPARVFGCISLWRRRACCACRRRGDGCISCPSVCGPARGAAARGERVPGVRHLRHTATVRRRRPRAGRAATSSRSGCSSAAFCRGVT